MSGSRMKLREHRGDKLRRYLETYPQWGFTPPRVEIQRPLRKFGSDYGGYCVNPSLLHKDAIVYSLGIGEDISFDLALMNEFGVQIEAFDPTPRVALWLAQQGVPRRFRFHATGITGHDGEETFYVPPRKDWVSHSVTAAKEFGHESIRFPVERLSTAMRRLGHARIDLLKMDIEGAEYEVIEDLIREKIWVTQLVVEFHHRLSSVGKTKTRRVLAQLQAYGLRISYVCPRAEVFTLIRTS